MTTIKSAIAALTLCLLITSTSFASNIAYGDEGTPVTALSKSLKTELSTLVQNPQLAKHNSDGGSVDVHFNIDKNGKIDVLKSNSYSPYLIQFIQDKIDGQELNSTAYTAGTTYKVRFTFELE
ncbi:MAG: hypothetical protein AB8F74_11385 [Saprospiraceae bacterium]